PWPPEASNWPIRRRLWPVDLNVASCFLKSGSGSSAGATGQIPMPPGELGWGRRAALTPTALRNLRKSVKSADACFNLRGFPMLQRIVPVSVVLALACAVPSRAQNGALDLVPSEQAIAAIVVRDLEGLLKKGDKFIDDTGFRLPLRPSELFREATRFLGIRGGLDDNGSGAIILLRPERDNGNLGLGDLEELLAGSLPFT